MEVDPTSEMRQTDKNKYTQALGSASLDDRSPKLGKYLILRHE